MTFQISEGNIRHRAISNTLLLTMEYLEGVMAVSKKFDKSKIGKNDLNFDLQKIEKSFLCRYEN